jgi:hypothetical protein
MQALSLRQTGADKQAQTPQGLRLSGSTPGSRTAFKLHLELTLKLLAKVRVVLGGTQ